MYSTFELDFYFDRKSNSIKGDDYEHHLPPRNNLSFSKLNDLGNMDWENSHVSKTVDGTLIYVWVDKWDKIHISTKNCWNAYTAKANDSNIDFGTLFERAMDGKFEEFEDLIQGGGATHQFFIVSKHNHRHLDDEEEGEDVKLYYGSSWVDDKLEYLDFESICPSLNVEVANFQDFKARLNDMNDLLHEKVTGLCIQTDEDVVIVRSPAFWRKLQDVEKKEIDDYIKHHKEHIFNGIPPPNTKSYEKFIKKLNITLDRFVGSGNGNGLKHTWNLFHRSYGNRQFNVFTFVSAMKRYDSKWAYNEFRSMNRRSYYTIYE